MQFFCVYLHAHTQTSTESRLLNHNSFKQSIKQKKKIHIHCDKQNV